MKLKDFMRQMINRRRFKWPNFFSNLTKYFKPILLRCTRHNPHMSSFHSSHLFSHPNKLWCRVEVQFNMWPVEAWNRNTCPVVHRQPAIYIYIYSRYTASLCMRSLFAGVTVSFTFYFEQLDIMDLISKPGLH